LDPWIQRLLHFEPHLAPPRSGADKPWTEKPKVIFVFGPIGKIGSRITDHIERRDLSGILREGNVLKVESKTRVEWRDGKATVTERTYFLLAFDEEAAARVERQILTGERVHFGLDSSILGMICQTENVVNAINAPIDTIRRLCKVGQGFELVPDSNPHERQKDYRIISADDKGALEWFTKK
jgi:hypothetical protein